MRSRTLIGLVIGAMLVVGASYFLITPTVKNRAEKDTGFDTVEEVVTREQSHETPGPDVARIPESVMETKGEDGDSTDGVVAVPKNTTTETASASQTPSTEPVAPSPVYTMQTVTLHGNATSCWTAINGKVYDLTSFVGKHPGGERKILSLCGIDGTKKFMGQHGGDTKPEKVLASFFLGPLTQ
jgi:cytochrome b involved in lipid metabolism